MLVIDREVDEPFQISYCDTNLSLYTVHNRIGFGSKSTTRMASGLGLDNVCISESDPNR